MLVQRPDSIIIIKRLLIKKAISPTPNAAALCTSSYWNIFAPVHAADWQKQKILMRGQFESLAHV